MVSYEVSTGVSERERWERERLLESLEAYRRGLADAPVVQKFSMCRAVAPNEDRPLTVVASDESADRLGDVVRAGGWDLDAYKHNPVFLWAHDYTRTPIGRSSWVGVDGSKLLATVEFAPTAFAQEVELLYRQRFLRAVSVGFRAREFSFRKDRDGSVDGVEYTRQELLELSAVPVPANPHALAKALEGGLETPRLRPLFTFDLPASCIAPEDAQASSASCGGCAASCPHEACRSCGGTRFSAQPRSPSPSFPRRRESRGAGQRSAHGRCGDGAPPRRSCGGRNLAWSPASLVPAPLALWERETRVSARVRVNNKKRPIAGRERRRAMRIAQVVRVALQAARLVDVLCRVAPDAAEALESGARLMRESARAAPDGLTRTERDTLASSARRFGEALAEAIEAAPVNEQEN